MATAQHPDAKYGRYGDTKIAHVEDGEFVVPRSVLQANPHLAAIIARAIRNDGADPKRYMVGEDNSINPDTGNPEFFRLGHFFDRGVGAVVKAAAPIVIGAFNPALGAAVGAGLGAANGGGIVGGITGAAGGYFGGSALGGAASGFAGAPVAGLIGPTAGGFTGALEGASAGIAGAGASLGSALGLGASTVGNASKILQAASLGSSLFGSGQQKQAVAQQQIGNPTVEPQAFSPVKPDAIARPNSLNELSGYSPEQERSALATKGNNTGLGSDENTYYKNLLARSLIGDGNKVNTGNPNFLMPIESSYFSKQGANTSDVMKFLQSIQS